MSAPKWPEYEAEWMDPLAVARELGPYKSEADKIDGSRLRGAWLIRTDTEDGGDQPVNLMIPGESGNDPQSPEMRRVVEDAIEDLGMAEGKVLG